MKIAIVGAGVLGRLLAFKLKITDPQLDISLFDKNDENHKSCSAVAAGMLSPFCELSSSERTIADLGCESIEIWKKDVPRIEEISQKKIFFRQNGTLVVAHRQDLLELKIFQRNIKAKLEPNEHPYKTLRHDEIYAIEPNLERKFHEAILFENDGQIDPKSLLEALKTALEKLNVKMFFGQNINDISENTINNKHYDAIFDCRGIEIQAPKIRGVRGEIITIEMKNFELNHCIRLIHPRFPLYIAPKGDGIFVIGATQIETEDTSNISVRSSLEMLTAIFSINSQFGEGRILETNTQLRPAFPDNLPRIIRNKNNNFVIGGLYRHGFLISPKIVDLTMQSLFDIQIDSRYLEICFDL